MTALGLPYPTIIGIVAGGEWASTVLDRVVADGRYGVRLGQSAAEAEAELRAAIAAACAADDVPARPPGDGRDHRRPVRVGAGAVRPSAAGRPRRRRRGRDRADGPTLLGEPYGADMQMFVNVGDTPCVIFGPGDVRVAHSADEHVPLDEVEACARVLAAWVDRELDRRPGSDRRRRRRRTAAATSDHQQHRDDDQRRAEQAEGREAGRGDARAPSRGWPRPRSSR